MRTLIITCYLFLFASSFAIAQKHDDNSLQEEGIKGKVKSLHETFFKAEKESGKIIPGKKTNSDGDYELKSIFDEKGYIIEQTTYNKDGKPSSKTMYAYDDKQKCAEMDHYNA